MRQVYFLFYVRDQRASARYYSCVLDRDPIVDVPGVTEFRLLDETILAVMPVDSARRLLGSSVPDPASALGVPKAEAYLVVDGPERFHERALAAGGRELSPFAERDWGHRAAYSIDADGNVLAFAEKLGDRATADPPDPAGRQG